MSELMYWCVVSRPQHEGNASTKYSTYRGIQLQVTKTFRKSYDPFRRFQYLAFLIFFIMSCFFSICDDTNNPYPNNEPSAADHSVLTLLTPRQAETFWQHKLLQQRKDNSI